MRQYDLNSWKSNTKSRNLHFLVLIGLALFTGFLWWQHSVKSEERLFEVFVYFAFLTAGQFIVFYLKHILKAAKGGTFKWFEAPSTYVLLAIPFVIWWVVSS
jgi:hypothetical protein